MTRRIEAGWVRTVLAGLTLALLGAVTLFALPDGVAFADTNQEKCASDGAVADAASNPGLVSDCSALLDSKKVLEGKNGGKLNWSSSLPMSQWERIAGGGGSTSQVKYWYRGYGSPGGPSNRVTGIYLRGFGLKGKIPSRLADLSELRELHLDYNQLRGRIPKRLGELSRLRVLDLMGNNLGGKIPPELGDLSQVRQLLLGGNELRGRIPKRLGNLSNVSDLGLSHNRLTGKIPKWFGDLSNLEYLHLRRNQFTGEIPSGLGEHPKLKVLELHFNNLTGCVPKSLRNFEYFNHIDASKPRLMYKDNSNRLSFDELWGKYEKGEIQYPFHKLPWCS